MNNKHQKLPALTALTTIVNNYKPVPKKKQNKATGITCNLSSKTTRVKSWNRRTRRVLLSQCQEKNSFLFICAKECSACELVRMDAQQAILHRYWNALAWLRQSMLWIEIALESQLWWEDLSGRPVFQAPSLTRRFLLKNFFAEWNRTVTIVQIVFFKLIPSAQRRSTRTNQSPNTKQNQPLQRCEGFLEYALSLE